MPISKVKWQGKAEGDDVVFQGLVTDGYFQEMVGMELLAGGYLSKDLDVDEYFDGIYDGRWEYVIN